MVFVEGVGVKWGGVAVVGEWAVRWGGRHAVGG